MLFPRTELRLTILQRLREIAEIGDPESKLILESIGDRVVEAAGTELIRRGAELDEPRMIISGWAGLAELVPDGRRQMLDIVLPGDLIGFSLHSNSYAKASVICLTAVETIKIPALADCLKTPERFPGTCKVLQRAQDQLENRLLNQIVRNGCQTADEKLCSLLLELYSRLADKGLAQHDSFELPITQIVIADVLGLSTVHVNRTLQTLKRQGIIQTESHRIIILNVAVFRKWAGNLILPRISKGQDLPASLVVKGDMMKLAGN